MKNDIKTIARQVANLPDEERANITSSTDEELPKILRELGIALPASSWWLRVLKIILYGLGIIMAGFGTAEAANVITTIY